MSIVIAIFIIGFGYGFYKFVMWYLERVYRFCEKLEERIFNK